LGKTAFYWDERCFWHTGGNYAFMSPVGGMVQPLAAGGIPESPETKRRLKNLMDVSGLSAELDMPDGQPATETDLARVHTTEYLTKFKQMSDSGGGEMGLRVPFLSGGYEIAALSAGLVKSALLSVLDGTHKNSYALSRPPGHHCLPDYPNGFCLLANIAIAIEAAKAAGQAGRVAVVDWDVHHGNGTEAIFLQRSDVLTISLHQERAYPADTGEAGMIGEGQGKGYNMNIPLDPGSGHDAYLYAFDKLVIPALHHYKPDVIIVACGFDASFVDPLARMLASAETYREMTNRIMRAADDLCDGRLVMAHEGGYSEMYVPFCGHAVIETMSNSSISVEDPLADRVRNSQPNERLQSFHREWVDELATQFGSLDMLG